MLPHNLFSLLASFIEFPGRKRLRQGLVLVWSAVIWKVWNHRNRIIFYNGVVNGADLVDDVKIASWKWWMGSGKSPPCLYYEWLKEPMLFMIKS
jgi:hypothetical protein